MSHTAGSTASPEVAGDAVPNDAAGTTSTTGVTEGGAPQQRSRLGNDLYTGRRSFPIIQRRRLWFAIGAALIALSILVLAIRGINPGIEFRGGSEFTVSGVSDTAEQPAIDSVGSVDEGQIPRVSQVGADSIRVQTEELSNDQTEQVQQSLAQAYDVDPAQVTSTYVGPTWGADVSRTAVVSLIVFLALVTLVMALYFRTVRMALGGIVALLHDLVVTVGVYALTGFEVTPATVIGFLTILGYSLYDTVVVFDKVRENTARVLDQDRYTYEEAANLAVNQTLVRSVHTSITGLLPVATILVVGVFLLGAGSLRDIALALFVGMLLSMISSVFIATPAVVELVTRDPKVKAHTQRVLAARAQAAGVGSATDDEALSTTAVGTRSSAGSAVTTGTAPVATAARSDSAAAAPVRGGHRGQAAQPKRRKGHSS